MDLRVVGWVVLAALGAPSITLAQEAPESPREDAVLARWMAHSREVASLRTQVRGARFDVVTATMFPNPQVALTFMGTPLGTPPDGRLNFGGQVTFALPVFGQLGARRAAAVAALSQSELSVATALWTRAADIQDAMVQRAYAHARVVGAEQNLAEIARIEDVIQRRVAAGANSQYDALRVAVTTATLRAALADALVERDRAEARLVAMVADPEVTAIPITREGLAAFRGPESLDALVAMALQRRPDVELARRGVAVSLATASRFRREAVPVPSVWVGAYGTQDQDSLSVQAGLSFTLPVFDRNQGLVGRAETEAEGQRLLASSIETRIRTEVRGAWNARADARTALETFQRLGITANAELLRRAEVTYQSGGTTTAGFTIVDLLDAYRTMWDARIQELALQRTFAEAEADLERAAALVVP